jgi:serine/threonine protein kinase
MNLKELLGKTIGDFNIKKLLGSGGMADVYLALQISLNREVALKCIQKSLQNQEEIQRFLREARLVAAIHHPNVIAIYSIYEEERYLFIVMEYIEGCNLAEMLLHSGLSEKEVWEYALFICKGLQAALKVGIIHRDIKPANILVDKRNGIKITDFGLSKKIDEDSQLTKVGTILGSPQFISPEQISESPVDFRSDIYSLGATLYYLLTGSFLFSGKNFIEVMLKNKTDSPLLPQFYNALLHKNTAAILGKMLSKSPSERYASYSDLTLDIELFLKGKTLKFALEPDCFKVYSASLLESPSLPKISSPSHETLIVRKELDSLHNKDFSKTIKKDASF